MNQAEAIVTKLGTCMNQHNPCTLNGEPRHARSYDHIPPAGAGSTLTDCSQQDGEVPHTSLRVLIHADRMLVSPLR